MADSGSSLPQSASSNGFTFGWAPAGSVASFYKETATTGKNMSAWIDTDSKDPLPIYDQSGLGSCTANAVAAALRYAWKKDPANKDAKYSSFDPSRLWIYYYGRTAAWSSAKVDSTPYNEGVGIRDAIRLLTKLGVCSEAEWPYPSQEECYQAQRQNVNGVERDVFPPGHIATTEPSKKAKDSVANYFNFKFQYFRIRALTDSNIPEGVHASKWSEVEQMRASIAEGYPVIFGFSLYSNVVGKFSWDPKREHKTGPKSDPWSSADRFLEYPSPPGDPKSGHAVLAIAYNHHTRAFLCQNSWGADWRNEGKFWLPYSWFENQATRKDDSMGPAFDLWVIRPLNAPIRGFHGRS